MIEELRKKSFKGLRIKLIVCAVIIVACLLATKCSIINIIMGPKNLTNNLDWDVKELEGKYVTLDLQFVNGSFAQETSTNRDTNRTTVTSVFYICESFDLELEKDFFYGVKVNNRRSDALDEVYDTYGECEPVTITGTFTRMPSWVQQYYEQEIEDNFGEEYLSVALPYYIADETIGGLDNFMAYLLNAVIVVCLILMVVVTVNFLRGNYDRFMKRYLKRIVWNPCKVLNLSIIVH